MCQWPAHARQGGEVGYRYAMALRMSVAGRMRVASSPRYSMLGGRDAPGAHVSDRRGCVLRWRDSSAQWHERLNLIRRTTDADDAARPTAKACA